MPFIVVDGRRFRVESISRDMDGEKLRVEEEEIKVEILRESSTDSQTLLIRIGERLLRIAAEPGDGADSYKVELNGRPLEVRLEHQYPPTHQLNTSKMEEGPLTISAPMSGRIVSVKASPGQAAEEGQPLVVLEAMKMENEIASPRKGIVKEVYAKAGASVKAGDPLLLVE